MYLVQVKVFWFRNGEYGEDVDFEFLYDGLEANIEGLAKQFGREEFESNGFRCVRKIEYHFVSGPKTTFPKELNRKERSGWIEDKTKQGDLKTYVRS